jgi:uncharacterized protein involved in outer membrane biogenesis
MRRLLLISLTLLIVLVAVGAGIGWYLINDEAFLKSRLNAYVLKETGRQLSVDGPLRLIPGRETTVEAEGIRLSNAAWADQPDMVQIGHFRVVVDIRSLFGEGPSLIPSIQLADCKILLSENEAGEANWDVLPVTEDAPEPEPGMPQDMPFLLLDTEIENCLLRHEAPDREQPLVVDVSTLSLQLIDGLRWQVSGSARVNDEDLALSGWLQPADALMYGGAIEHNFDAHVGKVSLKSSGTLQDARTGAGANLRLHFSGPEFANVLSYFTLPAISEGAFDFSLELNSEGDMTNLAVDGNLGSLLVNASGALDRLVDPQAGHVSLLMDGPDLEALALALGVEGFVSGPFTVQGKLQFESGTVKAQPLMIETQQDRINISGILGPAPAFARSDLRIDLHSQDVGRWRGRIGLPPGTAGEVALAGRMHSDDRGVFSIKAELRHATAIIEADGKLGQLQGVLQPDLKLALQSPDLNSLGAQSGIDSLPAVPVTATANIQLSGRQLTLQAADINLDGHRLVADGLVSLDNDYQGSALNLALDSPSAARLGLLFGHETLPAAPLSVRGRVERPDQRIRLKDVDLDLAGHRIHVDGLFNPEGKYSGSEFEVQLDTPDVAELALLFGKEGLPHEPMKLSGVLKPEGKGLQFQTQQGSLGDIRLDVDGHIPNLEKPLALDATFDIELPSLTLLAFLAPNANLPDLPFSAVGQLRNQQDRTQLQSVRLTLGDFAAGVTGDLYHDDRFDVSIDAGGPDASQLQQWLGQPLVPEPFSLRTRVTGNPGAFDVADIDVKVGESQLGGNLKIGLGTPKKVSGSLASPFLDLSHWRTEKKEQQPAASEPPSAYVFDDTRVMWIGDYGVDVDVTVSVTELDLGNTRLHDIELGVLLGRHRLKLAPFSLRGERGGAFNGYAILDDRGARPTLDVEMNGTDVRLGLAVAPGQDKETIPPLELDLSLHGSGFTRREMASGLDGKVRIFAGPGQIASAGINILFSDFLTELFSALNPTAKSNDYTKMECSVWAADIVDGRVNVEPVVVHLEEFTVLSKGTIDLQSEKINLSFNTKPRKGLGITPGTVINTLIKVGGSLKTPAIELDPAGTIVGGTAAVATAGLSVLAKGFSDRFLSSKDPCGDARKELAKRDP